MRYRPYGNYGKACKRTRVIPPLCPDTAMRFVVRLRMAAMRQKVQHRMAEVGESVNMTSELGVSFHSDNYAKKQNIDGKNRTLCGKYAT